MKDNTVDKIGEDPLFLSSQIRRRSSHRNRKKILRGMNCFQILLLSRIIWISSVLTKRRKILILISLILVMSPIILVSDPDRNNLSPEISLLVVQFLRKSGHRIRSRST